MLRKTGESIVGIRVEFVWNLFVEWQRGFRKTKMELNNAWSRNLRSGSAQPRAAGEVKTLQLAESSQLKEGEVFLPER